MSAVKVTRPSKTNLLNAVNMAKPSVAHLPCPSNQPRQNTTAPKLHAQSTWDPMGGSPC
jgi:hypothetical protein